MDVIETGIASITEEDLRAIITELAADRMEGRGPGTAGDRLAREVLARHLAELGYDPAGPDGGWEQPFHLVGVTATFPDTWEFRSPSEQLTLSRGNDFIAASGVQQEQAGFTGAEVVFVGYGITAPEEQWDDFKDADLRGKILLMLNNDPDWDPDLFGGPRRLYYGRWTYKYESAARQGAAGAVIIHTRSSAGYPWQVVQTSWSGEQFSLPAGDEARLAVHAWLTEAAARRLLALSGHDLDDLRRAARGRDFRPVPLDVRTDLAFTARLRSMETANVVGRLEGSDPDLADQSLVLSAHHDHLGRRQTSGADDGIYNGARDNASGVAQALEVAGAFAALPRPPRRSVVVLLAGAEEQGLLGSRHFAWQPPPAAGTMVANINFELGNIWGRTEVVVILGDGQTTLEDRLRAAAAVQGRRVAGDPDPSQGWYYRSDQLSFARAGVPALWFRSGQDFIGRPAGWGRAREEEWNQQHYHQPSDELRPEWDLTGMVEDARLAFRVGWAVCQDDAPPRFLPGSEFAGTVAAAVEDGAGSALE